MGRLIIEFSRLRAEYQLANTATSRAWQQLIRDPRVDLSTVINWQIYDRAYSEQALAQLKELTGCPEWQEDQFNQWHLAFEQQRHHDDRWHEINLLLHQAQHSLEDRSRVGYFRYDPALQLPEITSDQLVDFQYTPQPGDLVLGYHTVGKDLWAVYCDRDRNLAESRAWRRQRHLGPEFIIQLSARPQTHAQRSAKVRAWFRELGLAEPDLSLDPLGRPLLAKLITDLDQLESLIARDKPQKIWLEE